jgi:hypothetical protein
MKSIRCFGAILGLLLFAVSARAQDEADDAVRYVPRVQIAGGYAFVREIDVPASIPGGWFITADKNYNKSVGLTLDLSASGTFTRRLAYLPGHVTHWGTGGLLIGPTFSNRVNDRYVVFSRFLGGFASAGNGDDGYAAALAAQLGAGVDVNVTRHIGIRATADYRPLYGVGTASGARASQIWLRTGMVVSFGAAPASTRSQN